MPLSTVRTTGAPDAVATGPPETCCPHYHRAVELLGRRWTGAIVDVLLRAERPLRFGEIAAAVPEISDRLLACRLRELVEQGVLTRTDEAGAGPRYAATQMGRDLAPSVAALTAWGRRWLPAGR